MVEFSSARADLAIRSWQLHPPPTNWKQIQTPSLESLTLHLPKQWLWLSHSEHLQASLLSGNQVLEAVPASTNSSPTSVSDQLALLHPKYPVPWLFFWHPTLDLLEEEPRDPSGQTQMPPWRQPAAGTTCQALSCPACRTLL